MSWIFWISFCSLLMHEVPYPVPERNALILSMVRFSPLCLHSRRPLLCAPHNNSIVQNSPFDQRMAEFDDSTSSTSSLSKDLYKVSPELTRDLHGALLDRKQLNSVTFHGLPEAMENPGAEYTRYHTQIQTFSLEMEPASSSDILQTLTIWKLYNFTC
jgi:hypothetical protein